MTNTKSNLATLLRKLPGMIEGADAIPLFGNAPPFDWHSLSSLLSTRFEIKDFSVHPSSQSWMSPEQMKEELGANFFATPIYLNPLQPPFYFAIPKADKNKLTAAMMQGKTKTQISEPLKEGFCRFLVLEAVAAASAIEPISRLTPALGENAELPDESAFAIDVEIAFGEISCWSRLIFPTSFRKAWVEHFSMNQGEYFSSALARETELILGLECGMVVLSQEEWDGIEAGDFVLLDKGSFDPKGKTATAILKLGTTPLFQATVSEGRLELFDYVFTNEENMKQDSQGPLEPVEEDVVSIKSVPFHVSVELARLRISLDHLMHLNPGNILELPINPEQGVSLTVNGKKVGRAELLYLGESLGIRILELG